MEKWYRIDFIGSCEIEANTKEEAREKMLSYINENKALPFNLYNIEDIEDIEEL